MKSMLLVSGLAASSFLSPFARSEVHPYESCVQKLAEELLASTRLPIEKLELNGYGGGTYLSYVADQDDQGKWRPPGKPLSKGYAPHIFSFQARTPRTTLSFQLLTRLGEITSSEFGSGEKKTVFDCCLVEEKVSIKDNGSGLEKSFSLPGSGCGYGSAFFSDRKGHLSHKIFRTPLCSSYGRKTESWTRTRDWESKKEDFSYPCGTEHAPDRRCIIEGRTEQMRTIHRYTGCQAPGGSPMVDGPSADEESLL